MNISINEWVIIGEALIIAVMLFLLIARSGSAKEKKDLKSVQGDARDLRIAFNKRYGELSTEFRDIILRITNLLQNIEGEGGKT